MKQFLMYVCWCAFGNHDFQRLAGARTISQCIHCYEYRILPPLSFWELPKSFVTLEMRLDFLTDSIIGYKSTDILNLFQQKLVIGAVPRWATGFFTYIG